MSRLFQESCCSMEYELRSSVHVRSMLMSAWVLPGYLQAIGKASHVQVMRLSEQALPQLQGLFLAVLFKLVLAGLQLSDLLQQLLNVFVCICELLVRVRQVGLRFVATSLQCSTFSLHEDSQF